MGPPVPAQPGEHHGDHHDSILDGFRVDISHQEVERVIDELDQIFSGQTDEWLPVYNTCLFLCSSLGYEDIPELEDALKGTLWDFMKAMPHILLKEEQGEDGETKQYWKLRPPQGVLSRRPTKLTLHMKSRKDLYRVCLKSASARIEIPEMEFEIGSDAKRHIDTVYNHIGAAIYNLGQYVSRASDDHLSDDHKNKIIDTVTCLNILLDVDVPWTFVVHDPNGHSEFRPDEGIEVEYTEEVVGAPAA
eukprot:jgi/Mesvir1/26362/Mv16073-RA.1